MSRHLKNIVIDGLKSCGFTFETPPSARRSKGVRYFRACVGVDCFWGSMDRPKMGQARRKRIVVRPSRFRDGLFELYTYHFPKHWSAACVANRELIKEAQRQAHALEHDHSLAALEWRTRFLHHYFTVFRGGAKPEPGMKPYSRLYQYTYVAIYRELKAEQQKAQAELDCPFPSKVSPINGDTVTFEPVIDRSPLRRLRPKKLTHNILNTLHTNDRDFLFARPCVLYSSPPGDCIQGDHSLHPHLPQTAY
ncbi:MAG: hypothetical protein J6T71_01450 [Paludibacteraceae bacterium]|nr:hypothetical protein [Paludibacteraceae bacterium]